MKVHCSAFQDGALIDPRHTCSGENRSPSLEWAELPAGTKSLVLLLEDPDAPGGTFLHWSLYALDPALRELPEGLARTSILENLARQGRNSFGRTGYDGPCPPPGAAHRYFLKLYALDILPSLPGGAGSDELWTVITGHTLDQAASHGTFKRG